MFATKKICGEYIRNISLTMFSEDDEKIMTVSEDGVILVRNLKISSAFPSKRSDLSTD
jgi:hypothetical protein